MKIKNHIKRIVITASLLLLPIGFQTLPVQAAECRSGDESVTLNVDVGECKESTNIIYSYLQAIIRFAAAGVGMVLVLLVIIAGIRWMASGGNPQAIASAQKMLYASVVGLIAFIFTVALLNFLIPGGVIQF